MKSGEDLTALHCSRAFCDLWFLCKLAFSTAKTLVVDSGSDEAHLWSLSASMTRMQLLLASQTERQLASVQTTVRCHSTGSKNAVIRVPSKARI